MATVYKLRVTSHWVKYPEKELEKLIQKALDKIAKEDRNEITVEIEKK